MIILATKIVIYSYRDKTSRLIPDQVKLVLRDLFIKGKYWAETNYKVLNFLELSHPLYNEPSNL